MTRRLAVLVNRNAQGVSDSLLGELRRIVPTSLHVTTSRAEATEAVRTVIAGGYQALGVGGGDGTFMQAVGDLIAGAPAEQLPVLMPLRLGTGNAIADVSGSSSPTASGLARDLARIAGDEPPRMLKLLEVEGRIAQFAGVGLDADYAVDFRRLVKDRQLGGTLGRLARGVPGLAVTAAALTVPKLLVRAPRRIRVVALDQPAWRLADRGYRREPIGPGEVVYEGPFTVAAASTIHSYSNGMTFFPFAEMLDDAFHLRISAMSGVEILAALPRAFDGTYRHPRLLDFAARAIAIELGAPADFHIGGDLQAPAARFSVRLSRHSVPMLFRSA